MNEQWKSVTLGDVLVPVQERASETDADLVLSVTEKRGIIPQEEVFNKRIATADTSKYKVLRPLDIAYNPYLLWTGAVGQWLGARPGVTSPAYECFRVESGVSPRFVGLLLESGVLTPYFDSTAIGSIQRRRRTTPQVFLAATFSLPPFAVQRRIVDLMAHLDNHLASLRSERAAAGPVLGALQSAIPQANSLSIGDLVVGIDSGRSPLTDGADPEIGRPRILKLSAVRPGHFDDREAKLLSGDSAMPTSTLVQQGDVLVTRSNTPERVGYCARARVVADETYLPDLIWRVRLREDICDPDYFEQVLSSKWGRQLVTASATGTSQSMRKINKTGFSALRIPVPSLEDQHRYARDCLIASDVIAGLDTEAARLEQLRQVLLQGLLSGEITLPERYDALLGEAA